MNKTSRPPSGRSADQGSSTVRRAILLLDTLAQHPTGVGLSEVARAAKLHHATAYRLLSTLCDARLVELREGDRKYRLGLRVLELAGALGESLEIREVARPLLTWLAKTTGETVHLATLDGDEMVFLERVDGVQPVTLRTRVGFRAPAHVTAVGKAVLAFSPPLVVDRFLRGRQLKRYTLHTITGPDAFAAHLETVRRQGFAVDNEEHRLSIRCVGAPIFDHLGRPVAAVSIAGPMFRLSTRRMRELAEVVKQAARRISEALGHRVATSHSAERRQSRSTVP